MKGKVLLLPCCHVLLSLCIVVAMYCCCHVSLSLCVLVATCPCHPVLMCPCCVSLLPPVLATSLSCVLILVLCLHHVVAVLFDATQIPAGIALEFRVFSAFIKSYFEIHLHRIYFFFLSYNMVTTCIIVLISC